MRNIFIGIFLAVLCLGVVSFASAASAADSLDVYFFWGNGCPHCAKEKDFLTTLKQDFRDDITIHSHEVYYSQENQKLLQQFADEYDVQVTGVPTLFISDRVLVGFDSAETTGEEIREAIRMELRKRYASSSDEEEKAVDTVSVPFVGQVSLGELSLPVITLLIAAVDGFNPCAMWVLVLLIGMLVGMKSKKRLWILGTLFIFVSGIVYFVFLAAWFNFFSIVGAVRWIQIAVGIFALGAGGYYIRRYRKTRPGVCEVTNPEQKRKITERMSRAIHERSLLFAAFGIIILAALVNIIELACSAGLPAIYTQVLALHDMPAWQHYAYLLFYVFIFMLDDLIIFAIAVTTFRSVASSGKYTHIATLIGGIVILLLGLSLLFKPSWILFG